MPSFDELWDSTPAIAGAIAPSISTNKSFDQLWDEAPEPSAPKTFGNVLTGGALNVLNVLTGGLGDEITAGGAGAIDYLTGGPGYDARLSQARQLRQAFREQSPVGATLTDIGGAALTPIKTGVGLVNGFLPKAAVLAGEGGLYGGLYGFGEGQGGVENRLEGAKSGAILGALLNPTFYGAGATIKGIGSKASNALQSGADKLELSAFGATQAQVKSAIKKMPDYFDENGNYTNPLSKAIKSFREAGGAATGMQPDILLRDLTDQSNSIASEIGSKLAGAQKNQTKAIIPDFKLTDKYISGLAGVDKEAGSKLAATLKAATVEATGGSILGLQDEKIKLGQAIRDSAWGADATTLKPNILKRIRADLRTTIENSYEDLTGAPKSEISNLNKAYGQRESLYPLFEGLLAKSDTKDIAKSTVQNLRTSGGIGQLIVGSLAGGFASGPGAAIGVPAALVANDYLQSPAGKVFLANRFRGPVMNSIASAIPPVGRTIPKMARPLLSALLAGGSVQGDAQSVLPGLESQLKLGADRTPISQAKSLNPSLENRPMSETTQAKNPIVLESQQNISGEAESKLPPELKNKIEADPYFHATALTESGMDPLAKNPDSSAGGLFQFIDKTAKDIGLKDKYNPEQSFEAMQKLTKQNAAIVGNNPEWLYAAHVLGAGLAKKLKLGRTADLTERDKELVNYFKTEALPNFRRNYQRVKTLEA